MAVNPQAQALANLLGRVARYSVLLGVGGSVLQASLYTGMLNGVGDLSRDLILLYRFQITAREEISAL